MRLALLLPAFSLAAVLACGGSSNRVLYVPTETAVPVPTVDISTISEAFRPEFDSDPRLPGTYIPPNPGLDGRILTRDDFTHLDNGIRYPLCSEGEIRANRIAGCYNSNPPTSGPHSATPAQFRVYDTAVPKENLVHNMEHGAVVIWYNTTNAQVIGLLAQLANDATASGKLVVMSPYPDMGPDTIALTSWTRLDKFKASELTAKRVRDFIAVHERRFNPEGL